VFRLPYQGLPIIDCHLNFILHRPVASDRPELVKDYQRRVTQRFLQEWDFPPPASEADTEEDLAELWFREMERYGIDRFVFIWKLIDNARLAELVARCPGKFYGFASHDPAQVGAADELRRAVEEYGLIGYKLVAPRMTVSAWDDPALAPVWKYCAQRRLPVMIHFGPYGTGGSLLVHHPLINPLTLFPVAARYPEIPFIIPHFGCNYWGELLQLMWSCPNVYLDTSGTNQWVRWMPYRLDLEDLFRKAYETVGPERILFGTDSRDFPRGFSLRILQDQLRVCRHLNMKEEDLRAIFGGNASRLLGIPLGEENVSLA
jgi:predicted TIM-barrel fold metal-dependent hydrolase